MDNYRREQTDHRSLQVNQGLVDDHMDELYEEGDVFPSQGVLLPPAAGPVYVAFGAPINVFPDAALTAWEFQIPVRRLWNRAVGLELTVYYTGDVNSTNNFRVIFAGYGMAPGSVQGAAVDAFTTGVNIPGPAVAGTWLTTVYRSGGSLFTRASHYIIPRIVRVGADAADTYVGNLYIMAVHWKIFG